MSLIYAHRGASAYAPENTLRAFRLGAEMGADGVELDVQLTLDGEAVVFHDETLDRVTDETGPLRARTLAELRRVPVTLRRADGMIEPIPTLRETLETLHALGLCVNIELKNSVFPYPGLEEKTLDLVARCGMEDRVIYSSFNHASMQRVKQLNPAALCGLLYETHDQAWDYAAALGADALHPEKGEPLRVVEEIHRAHALGLLVNPWTVNDEEEIRLLLSRGADSVITNVPDIAVRVREELKAKRP